jgi:hypothetical protein
MVTPSAITAAALRDLAREVVAETQPEPVA